MMIESIKKMLALAKDSRLNFGIFVDSLNPTTRRNTFWKEYFDNITKFSGSSESITIKEITSYTEDETPGVYYRLLSIHDARMSDNRSSSFFDLKLFDILIINRDLLNEDAWFFGDLQIEYFNRILYAYLRDWVEDGGILIVDPQCTHWVLKQECYEKLNYVVRKDRKARMTFKTNTLDMTEEERRSPKTIPERPIFTDSKYCNGCSGQKLILNEKIEKVSQPTFWFPEWYKIKWGKFSEIGARIGVGSFESEKLPNREIIALDNDKKEVITLFEIGKGIVVVSTIYIPLIQRQEFIVNLVNCAFVGKIASTKIDISEKEIREKRNDLLEVSTSSEKWRELGIYIARLVGAGYGSYEKAKA